MRLQYLIYSDRNYLGINKGLTNQVGSQLFTDPGSTETMPRKRSLETSSSSSRKSGMHTGEKRATTSFSDEAATGAISDGQRSSEIEYVAPAVLASCRSALERSPAASRAALIKHRASIDPALARTLEAVGGYTVEKVCSGHFFCVYY